MIPPLTTLLPRFGCRSAVPCHPGPSACLTPCLLAPESGEGIEALVQQVPEGKHQKNRLHLDLRTADMETEVRRILGLGATLITDQPVMEDGWHWHILADPDGDELCVLQPPADALSTTPGMRL